MTWCLQLAKRLGGLPAEARAGANAIIADDPTMRPVAAAGGHSIPVRGVWLLCIVWWLGTPLFHDISCDI
jgi:hypothetical protein